MKCPFCESVFVDTFKYSLSGINWYLCHECGKVWDDKPKEENHD